MARIKNEKKEELKALNQKMNGEQKTIGPTSKELKMFDDIDKFKVGNIHRLDEHEQKIKEMV